MKQKVKSNWKFLFSYIFISKDSFYRKNSLKGDENEEFVILELFLIRFAAVFRVKRGALSKIKPNETKSEKQLKISIFFSYIFH